MADPDNPFQSPLSDDVASGESPGNLPRWTLIAWPIVFCANMVMPLLFGLAILHNRQGLMGIGVACAVLLIAGWRILVALPTFARSIIVAAGLFALTQFLPILQIIAGAIGISIGETLGLIRDIDDRGPEILSELGGFVVTILVGAMLMAVTVGFGILIHAISARLRANRAIANQ